MNTLLFEKRPNTTSYFAHLTSYQVVNTPSFTSFGFFLDCEFPFLKDIIKFIKSDNPQKSISFNEHHVSKNDDSVCIESDIFEEPDETINIHKETLIKLLETFLEFVKDGPQEIILTEESGIYTMTSQDKTTTIQ